MAWKLYHYLPAELGRSRRGRKQFLPTPSSIPTNCRLLLVCLGKLGKGEPQLLKVGSKIVLVCAISRQSSHVCLDPPLVQFTMSILQRSSMSPLFIVRSGLPQFATLARASPGQHTTTPDSDNLFFDFGWYGMTIVETEGSATSEIFWISKKGARIYHCMG